MSFNKAILIGNVGADPEIRTTNSGDRIANLRLATSERWKDKTTGERKESTEWHRVVCFNDALVGVIEQYVQKGSQISVEGQIKTRKWQDQGGVDRYSTEIVIGRFNGGLTLLGRREGGGGDRDEHSYGTTRTRDGAGGGYDAGQRQGYDEARGPREDFSADLDDEVPF
jgi:single-strand DNA-binding protein